MKGLILAAGRGSRLGAFTDELPKCMIEIGGKPMLHHAAEHLRSAGVTDLVVVRGYQANRIDCPGARFCDNANWSDTNVLGSLFSAEAEIRGDLIVCYSDIVFDRSVARAAVNATGGIRPVVDRGWRRAYVDRSDHPLSEAEKVVFATPDAIALIGKRNISAEIADGEFIGMLRLDPRGARQLADAYAQAKEVHMERSFQTADRFEAAYLTDLLQELIDQGERISPILINGGWREIDTPQDLENATAWLANVG